MQSAVVVVIQIRYSDETVSWLAGCRRDGRWTFRTGAADARDFDSSGEHGRQSESLLVRLGDGRHGIGPRSNLDAERAVDGERADRRVVGHAVGSHGKQATKN